MTVWTVLCSGEITYYLRWDWNQVVIIRLVFTYFWVGAFIPQTRIQKPGVLAHQTVWCQVLVLGKRLVAQVVGSGARALRPLRRCGLAQALFKCIVFRELIKSDPLTTTLQGPWFHCVAERQWLCHQCLRSPRMTHRISVMLSKVYVWDLKEEETPCTQKLKRE